MAAKLTVVTAFKTEGAAESERAAKALSREYGRLSAQLDPAIANQQRMERAQKTLDRALEKGKITQAEYNRQLALAKARYADAAGGAGRFRRSIEDMTASFGRMAAAAAVALGALALVTLGKSLRAWEEEAKAVRQLEAALASTGNAAGRTVAQLQAQASALQRTTETADTAILVAQSQLLTFTKVTGQVFDRAIESVLDLSVRMDQDLRTSVIAVGKALNYPVKGLGSLSRAGIQFTEDQKAMVKALVEIGDMVGAQTIILKELETQFGGSAQAARDAGSGLVPLQNAASDLLELIGGGLAPAVRELTGDLEDLATDPATINFFRDLGQSAGELLSVLKIVTGQLHNFSIGWLRLRADALVTLALIRQHAANVAQTVNQAPGWLRTLAFGGQGAKAIEAYAEESSRIAAETARAALDASMDLAAALTGIDRGARDAAEGLGTTNTGMEETGRGADDLKDRLKSLKAEITEHEKAIRAAEKAIQEAQKRYKEFSGAIDDVREALGDLMAIELSDWLEDTYAQIGPIGTGFTGLIATFGSLMESMSRIPQTTEDWNSLAESIKRADEALAELSGRDTIALDVEAELGGMVLPGVDPEDMEEMQENWEKTIGQMSVALEAMMKRAWENVQDIAADAIGDTFKGWLETGNDTLDRWIGSVIDMLAQMLVLWLANLAKRVAAEQAAAAASAAAWAAASAAGGGGGGGGVPGIGGLLGGFGSKMMGASSGSAAGSSQTSWMAGGALGALAIGAVMVGAYLYLSSEAAKKAARRWVDIAEIREGWNAMFGSADVLGVTKAVRDQVEAIFAAIGGSLDSLPAISVSVQANGEKFRSFVGGVLVGYFETFEEAFEAAALQAVEQSDLSRMIPEIAAALNAGTIYSLDQLQDVAEVFATIRQALDPTGASVDAFNAQIEEMGRILDAAGIARTALAEFEAAGYRALRDQITGVTKSAQQLFNEQMESFNRRIEEQRALETAALAVAEAEQAAAVADVARLQAQIAGMQALTFLTEKQAEILARMIGDLALAEAMLVSSAAAAAAAQAALDALPDPIKPGEFKGGGGGSGSRKSDMEALRDLLDQMSFDRLLFGMTELEAGLARLAREYDQNLEKAHGNAELVAQLTEEYRLQAEQLLRNVQLSAVDVFRDFMGIGASPFAQLKEQWEDARKAVEEAGFGADRASQMLARLNRRYEEQLDFLSRQTFVGIGDGLLGILERYYGEVEGFELFRRNLERIRFELELANLRLQFEVLKANGTLSEKMLKRMQRVFDFIDKNPVDWGKFVTPDVPIPGLDKVNDRFQETNNLLEEMARRLVSAKEGITDFLLSLQTGELGGRSSAEMFQAAYEQFQRIVTQGRAGNIQALEQFPEIARRLAEITRERFGSGASFQDILSQIEDAGIDLLNVRRVTQDNIVFDPAFMAGQRDQIDLQRAGVDVNRSGFAQLSAISDAGFSALAQEGAQQTRTLRAIADRLAKVEAEQRQTREYLERKAS